MVTRVFDVGPLAPGPVLVVPARDERPMVQQQRSAALGVDAGDIAHVVAVGLEESDHRNLRVRQPVGRGVARSAERAVVGDLVRGLVPAGVARRARDGARVEAVAAVVVVRLPRGVRRLHDDVGVAGLVAHHEGHQRPRSVVVPHEVGDVDAGDRARGHRPGRRYRPVAAVDQAARRIGDARGLRGRGIRPGERRDLPRAVALVVAEAQDVHVVGARGRADLDRHRPADCGAHRGGEALQGGVARAVLGPRALGCAGQRVLTRDDARDRGAALAGSRSRPSADPGSDTDDHRRAEQDRGADPQEH